MPKVVQDHFPRTINQYVPNMEFAADVVGDIVIANLGAPAAPDPDGIWDGVSATDSATSYTSANYKYLPKDILFLPFWQLPLKIRVRKAPLYFDSSS